MGLQGTLDTFTVAEVLGLVEHARQTGALEVKGPQGTGTLFASAGRLCAGEAADYSGPVETREELDIRLVDVCFHLFRLESGAYEFIPGKAPPWPAERATDMAPIVEQAERLVRDWPRVQAVIPSLDVTPQLADDLTDDQLTLDRAAFRVLATADGHRSVRQMARALGRSAVEVAAAVKDLVEHGALRVESDTSRAQLGGREVPPGARPDRPDRPEPPEPDAAARAGIVLPPGAVHAVREEAGTDGESREVVTSVPEPTALDADALARERQRLAAKAGLDDPGPVPTEDDEAGHDDPTRASITQDRGALLRLFSGLRDNG